MFSKKSPVISCLNYENSKENFKVKRGPSELGDSEY